MLSLHNSKGSWLPLNRLGRDVLIIWIPLFLLGIYLVFYSSEQYCSSASYRILDNGAKKSTGVDLGFLGIGASLQNRDEGVMDTYLTSMDALNEVDKVFDLKSLYSSDELDVFHRLNHFSTREDYLRHYQKNIRLVTDQLSGLTLISVLDTDPERARLMVEYLLGLGERFLNDLNHKNAEKRIAFIKEQLEANNARLQECIAQLEAFQKEHGVLDPKADVEVQYAIIANLEQALVEKRGERNQLLTFMDENSVEIERLSGQIVEMETEVTKARMRLTGEEGRRMNALVFQYEELRGKIEFANEVYKQALVQYEVGRMEALQESKILEVITLPTTPEDYSRPKKMKWMLTAVVLLFLLSRISRLIFAVIEDHKD
ncbi:hypothetical protein [Desulfoluna spongiiphila]|uniref:hypothetical protein n=1 Tax=Desulfoluna spongiiphila TaxID=419481 RepID=UPI0012539791|nr:hypothetical protein [Desulfoluna spongiiphila]VVS92364.1 hypothetical protein DBB_19320 [Desulfoluna spongiiphila]